jgi:hypothetical protein
MNLRHPTFEGNAVSISGAEFRLNGQPTYKGREFEGHRVQGLLFNVRAVQAAFDDANRGTRHLWAYPDTGEWHPDRNTEEFCAALCSWRDHGVSAFTINFQGGGPLYAPEIYEEFDNNGFTPEGHLKPAYAGRISRVLSRADELGMVVIVGLFYCVHIRKMRDESAVWSAAHEALEFLEATGHRNLLVEMANETSAAFGYEIFLPERAHETIGKLRAAHPRFLYSTSLVGVNAETGQGMPPASLVEASDFVLLHGNETRPAQLAAAVQAVKAMPGYELHPKPIVINEDSPGLPNLEAAWRNGASWGYFDQGFGGAAAFAGDAYVDYRSRPRETRYGELSGFQTPPVNWSINTDLKRAFFRRVAEITGCEGGRNRHGWPGEEAAA